MSNHPEILSDGPTQERVAGAAFLTGVIAGLIVFALFVDDRIASSWGDWVGQGLSMIGGVVVATACWIPFVSSKSSSTNTFRHLVFSILLIVSTWGTAAAAACWGTERLSSAVWLMSLGGFGLLLQKSLVPYQKLGRWAGLYFALFILGALASIAEIVHWE